MVNMMGGDGDAVFRVDLDAPSPRPNKAGIRVLDDGSIIAARSSRLFGWFIDLWVVALCAFACKGVGVAPRDAVLIVDGLYFVIATRLWGMTLGKRAAGIQVVSADGAGRISLWQSAVRWLTVNAMTLVTVLIAYALPNLGRRVGDGIAVVFLLSSVCIYSPVYFSREGRGLHDVAARTMVLKRRF
jgi:uncharacterized RDD family membrane protein YckC